MKKRNIDQDSDVSFTESGQNMDELVKACQKYDRRAQALVFEKFSRRLLSIAYRYSGEYDTANDLLQDGFIKIFNNIRDYRFEGSFEGWMRRVMVNTCINYLRKKKKIEFERLDFTDSTQWSESPSTIENLNCEDIMEEIKKMPSGFRTVLNLYAIEGYSYTEIAEMLGLKEVSVRTQYMRAKENLSLALKKKLNINYVTKVI